jgi:hypothetical protein
MMPITHSASSVAEPPHFVDADYHAQLDMLSMGRDIPGEYGGAPGGTRTPGPLAQMPLGGRLI